MKKMIVLSALCMVALIVWAASSSNVVKDVPATTTRYRQGSILTFDTSTLIQDEDGAWSYSAAQAFGGGGSNGAPYNANPEYNSVSTTNLIGISWLGGSIYLTLTNQTLAADSSGKLIGTNPVDLIFATPGFVLITNGNQVTVSNSASSGASSNVPNGSVQGDRLTWTGSAWTNYPDGSYYGSVTTSNATTNTIVSFALSNGWSLLSTHRTIASGSTNGHVSTWAGSFTFRNEGGTVTMISSNAYPRQTNSWGDSNWTVLRVISGTNVLASVVGDTNETVNWAMWATLNVVTNPAQLAAQVTNAPYALYDIDSLYSDSGGATNRIWDSSGNALHLTNGTFGPTISTTASLNSHKGATFLTPNISVTNTAFTNYGPNGMTMIMVMRQNQPYQNDSVDHTFWDGVNTSNRHTFFMSSVSGSASSNYYRIGGSVTTINDSYFLTNKYFVVTVLYSNDSAFLWTNNVFCVGGSIGLTNFGGLKVGDRWVQAGASDARFTMGWLECFTNDVGATYRGLRYSWLTNHFNLTVP